MFKNIYYDTYKSVMHLWYTANGVNRYRADNWTPYVYKKDPEGDIKTIDGLKVSKMYFNSYSSYKEYQQNNKDLYENNCKPEIQYLAEKYYDVIDEDIIPPALKIYSIDIEVQPINNPGVFPSPLIAEEPITMISIYDWLDNHVYSFGLHEYDNSVNDDKPFKVTYINCGDEKSLLRKFFSFTHKNAPDVYTGWNISLNKKMSVSGFDFPYIINRSKNLFEEDLYLLLSPIKKVRAWKSNEDTGVSISGVSIIDYQCIYKWFTRNNLEKYTLDYVCKFELNEVKLEYKGSLAELYNNDWQKYVDYNIRDVELIKLLDDKLEYINLAQSLSLLTRAPMESYIAMTALLEGKLLTHFRREGLCAPIFEGGTQHGFPAAYVKEPHVGLWDWISSIDIASSYPTAIITLNMSVETYLGRIQTLTEDHIILYTKRREFPPFTLKKKIGSVDFKGDKLISFNKMLDKGLIAIAPCGSCFKTSKEGVIAYVEREMFIKRKQIKTVMKSLYDDDSKKDEVKRLFAFQWALKILLNSMFGIMAVPYSRYFQINIAEAITACGRHNVKQGELFTNEILNDIMNKDLVKIIGEIKEK